ncbi:hypothetical protein BC567DRAFT_233751 [Phyllosticta citribraziliensis]
MAAASLRARPSSPRLSPRCPSSASRTRTTSLVPPLPSLLTATIPRPRATLPATASSGGLEAVHQHAQDAHSLAPSVAGTCLSLLSQANATLTNERIVFTHPTRETWIMDRMEGHVADKPPNRFSSHWLVVWLASQPPRWDHLSPMVVCLFLTLVDLLLFLFFFAC